MTSLMDRVIILDGSGVHDRQVVGGKGASIAEMRSLGLPVPPAFCLPVDECRRYHASGGNIDDDVWAMVLLGLQVLERETGRMFGDAKAPMLVSVRSGAPVSMPGMMDTILNLGMTDDVERALARMTGDAKFAHNTHLRFIHDFGCTALGADIDYPDPGSPAAEVRASVLADTKQPVPVEPYNQLRGAIHAVFESWTSRRAVAYRKHWGIPEEGGTAVIVQAMVFGNMANRSGTGVLFTRNPLNGEPDIYGEWLPGGQGEDVVSGEFDPLPLQSMAGELPDIHSQLIDASRALERHQRDVQDIEFTVEEGRLYLLQSRTAKRSPQAAVRIAVDLAEEGLIDRREALRRVSPEQLISALAPRLSEAAVDAAQVLARGTPACPGVATGRVVLDSDAAEAAADDIVLARSSTSPGDVSGMIAARGLVTEHGGATSHAAVVSRALGRPSVVGVGGGVIEGLAERVVTVDGTAGVVYDGALSTTLVEYREVPGLETLAAWASELSPVSVVDEAPDVLDLDDLEVAVDARGEIDTEALASRMSGSAAVRGSILASPEGARAVIASGVPSVLRLPGQPGAVLLVQILRAEDEV